MGLFDIKLSEKTVDSITTKAMEKLKLVLDAILKEKKISITVTFEEKDDGVIRKR